jgi:hypothetical protein
MTHGPREESVLCSVFAGWPRLAPVGPGWPRFPICQSKHSRKHAVVPGLRGQHTGGPITRLGESTHAAGKSGLTLATQVSDAGNAGAAGARDCWPTLTAHATPAAWPIPAQQLHSPNRACPPHSIANLHAIPKLPAPSQSSPISSSSASRKPSSSSGSAAADWAARASGVGRLVLGARSTSRGSAAVPSERAFLGPRWSAGGAPPLAPFAAPQVTTRARMWDAGGAASRVVLAAQGGFCRARFAERLLGGENGCRHGAGAQCSVETQPAHGAAWPRTRPATWTPVAARIVQRSGRFILIWKLLLV